MSTINAIDSNIPIEITKGGTNATSMATNDGVLYFDGTRLVTTGVGTSGQILTSNGSGAPTFSALSKPSGTPLGQARSTSKGGTSTTTVINNASTTPTTANTAALASITYTPANTSNVLIFEWTSSIGCPALADYSVGFSLFQTSTLQCTWSGLAGSTNELSTITGRYQQAAGTTSSTTYAVRYFLYCPTTGTAYINQDSANNTYNSSLSYTFIITEVVA